MNKIEVLLVEDNPADADLIAEIFETGRSVSRLHVAMNGEAAFSYLQRKLKNGPLKEPQLILLDLNLPGQDGRQVLSQLKHDEHLKKIPVIILTSSTADEDIQTSYLMGANCYIVKPVDLSGYQLLLRAVENYWFGVARLPSLGTTGH